MIEARAFVEEIDSARTLLGGEEAELKGFYKIHDTIFYNSVTSAALSDEFLRLRYVPENIWEEKAIILAIKKTVAQKTGKTSEILTKVQFDTIEDALEYYQKNLAETYSEDYSFWRDGWQYYLPNGDIVDLEVIGNTYPSIEFKSETDEGIEELLRKFGVSKDRIITGPSVTAVRELLKIS